MARSLPLRCPPLAGSPPNAGPFYVMKTVYQLRADITGAKDRFDAWGIIQQAPAEMRDLLIRHAQTVFAIRRFHARKKARPGRP